jgi:mono/diheme cytochrome c family protein
MMINLLNQNPIAFRAMTSLAVVVCLMATSAHGDEKAAKITYNDHAKPIFMQRCSSCHNAERSEGDLDLTNYTNLMIGGGSGEVIEAGSAEESYLFRLVTHEESPEMPPGDNTIPEKEIDTLRKWIDQGALENSGSVAKKRKPKTDYSAVDPGDKKPEVEPVPSRMPLEPPIVTARPSTVHSIAANPWSPYVAISSPRQVLVYRTSDMKFRATIPFPEGQPEKIRFSRNGQLLIIGGGKAAAAGKVVIWDAIKGRRVTVVGDSSDAVLAADINPSQTLVAHGGPKKIVEVCDINGEPVYELKKHTDWVTALQFSPNGELLLTGDRNGGLLAWEAETGNEIVALNGHSKAITAIDWRVDGKLVLTASQDGSVRIWDSKNGKQIKTWKACGIGVTDACFTRDGKVVTAGRDHLVRMWDQNGKQLMQTQKLPDQVVSVAYCNESDRIVAGDWSGNIRVWESGNPKHVGTLLANPPTLETRIAASEKRLQDAKAVLDPLQQQWDDRASRIAAIKAAAEADVATRAQLDATVKALAQKLTLAGEQLEATVGQQASWKKELDEKNAAVPLIEQALSTSQAAASSLPSDAELAATVKQLQSKKATIATRIGELKQQLQMTNQKREVTQAEIASLKTQRQESAAGLTAISARIAEAEMELGKLNDQQQKAKPELDGAIATVRGQASAVEYWKSEVEFANRLAQLEASLEAASLADHERLDMLEAEQERLAAAQAKVDVAKQRREESAKRLDSIEQQIQQLKDK